MGGGGVPVGHQGCRIISFFITCAPLQPSERHNSPPPHYLVHRILGHRYKPVASFILTTMVHHHYRHGALCTASIPLFILSPTPSSRPSRYLLLNSSQLRNRNSFACLLRWPKSPLSKFFFHQGFSIIFSRVLRDSLSRYARWSVCRSAVNFLLIFW